jgi:ABC-type nitrate/sulfonate/bicarbonate transport system permease component
MNEAAVNTTMNANDELALSRKRRVRARRIALRVLEIGTPIAALAAWWFGSQNSQNPFFPSLREILIEFRKLWLFDKFGSDVIPSIVNFSIAYIIACVVGIALGILLALVWPLHAMLDPVLQFIRSIPAVALLPIFVALFGFGNGVRVFAIALSALFPVLISTVDGARGTEPLLLETVRVYRLTPWERLRWVYLPAASPQIFSGAVVSLQVAFIVMITSEMLGSAHGIGALTMLAQKSFDAKGMWAGILLLGILGYLVNLLFTLVQNRVLSWYRGAQQSESAE